MTSTVTITFPADTRNVALARSVAAAMAARADLPLDQLEDVRLAVDETVSQLILDAVDDADITCAFTLRESGLEIVAACASVSEQAPATDTFSWTVLRALVDEVTADVAAGVVTLRLSVTRSASVDV